MGQKLNLAQLPNVRLRSSTNFSQKRVSMSLTRVAAESKVKSFNLFASSSYSIFELIAFVYVIDLQVQDIETEKRDSRTVASIILGGGAGTRLFPLTKRRAKPAVSSCFSVAMSPVLLNFL